MWIPIPGKDSFILRRGPGHDDIIKWKHFPRYWPFVQGIHRSPVGHDDIIKWKHFPRYWPFVQGIHPSPVNSPHKGQWCRALMFPLICIWINGWVNNLEAGDLICYHAHYDVTVMLVMLQGLQQPQIWQCRTNGYFSSMGKAFNYLYYLNFEIWNNFNIPICFLKQFSISQVYIGSLIPGYHMSTTSVVLRLNFASLTRALFALFNLNRVVPSAVTNHQYKLRCGS